MISLTGRLCKREGGTFPLSPCIMGPASLRKMISDLKMRFQAKRTYPFICPSPAISKAYFGPTPGHSRLEEKEE